MSLDRRKVLRGMIAAMAASGLTLAQRREALAAAAIGQSLTDGAAGTAPARGLNRYFAPALLSDTVKAFKGHFGSSKSASTYKFGKWILLHDSYFDSDQTYGDPSFHDSDWSNLVNNVLPNYISDALTRTVNDCVYAAKPIPMKFVVAPYDPSVKEHEVDITTQIIQNQPWCVVTMKCDRP
jgi:hypothetical protein